MPYAVVGLTVVRMVPVLHRATSAAVSSRGTALVLGWLGPRGLASIVFGLLAYIGLTSPQNDTVADVMVATVALSVVLPRPDGPD